eukprot:2863814-Pleurochrysis_carterae.AAC.1
MTTPQVLCYTALLHSCAPQEVVSPRLELDPSRRISTRFRRSPHLGRQGGEAAAASACSYEAVGGGVDGGGNGSLDGSGGCEARVRASDRDVK